MYVEGKEEESKDVVKKGLSALLVQIVLLDIVFSFDSILTAVGLVRNVEIMVLAVLVAMVIMLLFSEVVSTFVNKHPTIKMLALAFLLMIGLVLLLDAAHIHVPKPYIYTAMVFSLLVEALNMRMRSKRAKKGAAAANN